MTKQSALTAACFISLIVYLFLVGALFLAGVAFGYATSFETLLLSVFLPMLAPVYWIWFLWADGRGLFFNLYTLACIALVAALSVYVAGSEALKKY